MCLQNLDLEPHVRIDLDRQLAHVLGELHSHTAAAWGGVDDIDEAQTWADLFTARLREARTYPAVSERLAPEVLERVDDAIELAPTALRDAGPPTLVHGDVWDGNLIVHPVGDRWEISGLLDPGAEFADVELLELAYLEVFDQRREAFFAAYTDRHSLRPGYERRRRIYWLHTALVHVGLFGDEFFCDFTARTAESILLDE